MSLAEELAGWTDWDYAAYLLGTHLGLLTGNFATRNKHVSWTENQLGNGLHAALHALVDAGVLERRTDPDEQFRWVGNGT